MARAKNTEQVGQTENKQSRGIYTLKYQHDKQSKYSQKIKCQTDYNENYTLFTEVHVKIKVFQKGESKRYAGKQGQKTDVAISLANNV